VHSPEIKHLRDDQGKSQIIIRTVSAKSDHAVSAFRVREPSADLQDLQQVLIPAHSTQRVNGPTWRVMTLDLTDEQTAVLLAELDRIIDGDRYPFSPRIQTLTAIRDRLRPPPVRQPLPPPLPRYEPRARRRRRG
jgi:hypothetical protein